MQRFFLPVVILLTGLLVLPQPAALAQATHTLDDESKVWVDGTSNKSDWTVHATELDGSATLSSDDGLTIESLDVTIPSEKMLSQKSSIMDRLMHRALDVRTHPEITYSLKSIDVEPGESDAYTLKTTGDLTLAGTTKPIAMDVQGELLDAGLVRFTGSHTFLMTDFGMEPPSAMFGSLRTGDEVTVQFDVVFAPSAAGQ